MPSLCKGRASETEGVTRTNGTVKTVPYSKTTGSDMRSRVLCLFFLFYEPYATAPAAISTADTAANSTGISVKYS